jgi:hypothetical protein
VEFGLSSTMMPLPASRSRLPVYLETDSQYTISGGVPAFAVRSPGTH